MHHLIWLRRDNVHLNLYGAPVHMPINLFWLWRSPYQKPKQFLLQKTLPLGFFWLYFTRYVRRIWFLLMNKEEGSSSSLIFNPFNSRKRKNSLIHILFCLLCFWELNFVSLCIKKLPWKMLSGVFGWSLLTPFIFNLLLFSDSQSKNNETNRLLPFSLACCQNMCSFDFFLFPCFHKEREFISFAFDIVRAFLVVPLYFLTYCSCL